MKQKATYLFLFGLAVVATIGLLQYSLDRLYVLRVDNKINRVFQHRIDSPIMVFGSSVAHTDVNPDSLTSITGLGCFNMGTPGMTFAQYEALILEFAQYSTKCKAVVLCCDLGNLDRNPLITWPNLFYAYLGSNKYVYDALYSLEPQSVALQKYVPGYKLTRLNKEFYCAILEGKLQFRNGFGGKKADWAEENTFWPQYVHIDTEVLSRFRKCISILCEKKMKVFIVINPEQADAFRRVLNMGEMRGAYKQLERDGVYVLDYSSDTMNNRRSYFYNYRHLNLSGAAVFSHKLAHDMYNILEQK